MAEKSFLHRVFHPIETIGEIVEVTHDLFTENDAGTATRHIVREVSRPVVETVDDAVESGRVVADIINENGWRNGTKIIGGAVRDEVIPDPPPSRFSPFPQTAESKGIKTPIPQDELIDEDLIVLTVYNTGIKQPTGHVSLRHGGYVVDQYPKDKYSLGTLTNGPSMKKKSDETLSGRPDHEDSVTYVMTKDQLKQYFIQSGKSEQEAQRLVDSLVVRMRQEAMDENYGLKGDNCVHHVCRAIFAEYDGKTTMPQALRRRMNDLVDKGLAVAVRYDDPGLRAYYSRGQRTDGADIKRGEQAPAPEERQEERDEGRDGAANQPSLRQTISAAQQPSLGQGQAPIPAVLRGAGRA